MRRSCFTPTRSGTDVSTRGCLYMSTRYRPTTRYAHGSLGAGSERAVLRKSPCKEASLFLGTKKTLLSCWTRTIKEHARTNWRNPISQRTPLGALYNSNQNPYGDMKHFLPYWQGKKRSPDALIFTLHSSPQLPSSQIRPSSCIRKLV